MKFYGKYTLRFGFGDKEAKITKNKQKRCLCLKGILLTSPSVSKLSKMKILVTGAAGYLGMPLVKTLRGLGAFVVGLDVVSGECVDIVGSVADEQFVLDLGKDFFRYGRNTHYNYMLHHFHLGRTPGAYPVFRITRSLSLSCSNRAIF